MIIFWFFNGYIFTNKTLSTSSEEVLPLINDRLNWFIKTYRLVARITVVNGKSKKSTSNKFSVIIFWQTKPTFGSQNIIILPLSSLSYPWQIHLSLVPQFLNLNSTEIKYNFFPMQDKIAQEENYSLFLKRKCKNI